MKFRHLYGHTRLSMEEKIPWKCRRQVIGTGTGALPVMQEVKREAKRRKIELLKVPTDQAIALLKEETSRDECGSARNVLKVPSQKLTHPAPVQRRERV
jgi:hypothetical protein